MTPEQTAIRDAAEAMLELLDESVPTTTAHWAVEDMRRACARLARTTDGLRTNDAPRPVCTCGAVWFNGCFCQLSLRDFLATNDVSGSEVTEDATYVAYMDALYEAHMDRLAAEADDREATDDT